MEASTVSDLLLAEQERGNACGNYHNLNIKTLPHCLTSLQPWLFSQGFSAVRNIWAPTDRRLLSHRRMEALSCRCIRPLSWLSRIGRGC